MRGPDCCLERSSGRRGGWLAVLFVTSVMMSASAAWAQVDGGDTDIPTCPARCRVEGEALLQECVASGEEEAICLERVAGFMEECLSAADVRRAV